MSAGNTLKLFESNVTHSKQEMVKLLESLMIKAKSGQAFDSLKDLSTPLFEQIKSLYPPRGIKASKYFDNQWPQKKPNFLQ